MENNYKIHIKRIEEKRETIPYWFNEKEAYRHYFILNKNLLKINDYILTQQYHKTENKITLPELCKLIDIDSKTNKNTTFYIFRKYLRTIDKNKIVNSIIKKRNLYNMFDDFTFNTTDKDINFFIFKVWKSKPNWKQLKEAYQRTYSKYGNGKPPRYNKIINILN